MITLLFERPQAAYWLLLPIGVLLLLKLFERPPRVVIGTLDLWLDLPEARGGGHARRRFPLWALVLALALTLGALALLGPRFEPAFAPRTFTLVLDDTPSMHLPLAPGDTRTRLEAALAAAEDGLASAARAQDRVRWVGADELELALGERPSAAWFARLAKLPEPDWARYDFRGALWVTDQVPELPRTNAGVFASGGAAIPGPISSDGKREVLWDGERLTARARATPLRFSVRGELCAVLERVLAAWGDARGFARGAAGESVELEFEVFAAEARPLLTARDGWQARGRGADLPPSACEEWLSGTAETGETLSLVRFGPGRIELSLRELEEPRGDPAAFALSWARLFDRAARAGGDVVPLDERQAAGDSVAIPGRAPLASGGAANALGPYLDAGLALGAACLAGAAWFLLRAARERDPGR